MEFGVICIKYNTVNISWLFCLLSCNSFNNFVGEIKAFEGVFQLARDKLPFTIMYQQQYNNDWNAELTNYVKGATLNMHNASTASIQNSICI